MPNEPPTADDPAEMDLLWEGYSGWAMLPSFLLCTGVSLALVFSGWYFDDIRGLGEGYGSTIFFWIAGLIWVVQIVRWLYRGSSYCYRLTNKHLFIDYGFCYDRTPEIPLVGITRVEWGRYPYVRRRLVGWVRVHTADGAIHHLSGVSEPETTAAQILAARERLLQT